MVAYGPWVQDPDYPQDYSLNDQSPEFDFGRSRVDGDKGWNDPAVPVELRELEGSVEAAYGGGANDALSLWGVAYSWFYELSFPQWRTTWAATVARRVYQITPRTYDYNPLNYGPLDPEAVGIEFEGQPFDPDNPWSAAPAEQVGLSVLPSTRLGGVWADTSVGAAVLPTAPPTEVRLISGSGATTLATVPPSSVVNVGPNPTIRTLDVPIDLTGLLVGWSGSIHTQCEPPFAPPADDPTTVNGDANNLVRYGWGIERLWLRATVRPPRWRWVYDAEAAESYRRIFPRDDGLAGGAGRVFPRPSSIQGSSRTSGYL